jgi:hypothetical protein
MLRSAAWLCAGLGLPVPEGAGAARVTIRGRRSVRARSQAVQERVGSASMKRLFNWQVGLSVVLISLSVIVYYIHYLIFHDAHHIFIYLIGDIGFVFIEVLLVTIIIHQLLGLREKQALLQKLNMVIGAFYSEVGLALLRILSEADERSQTLADALAVRSNWTTKEFSAASFSLAERECALDMQKISLETLKEFLAVKRDFLLRLLENPNLLEHETFTNLLWAVFHVTEELSYRRSLQGLSAGDAAHLAGDMKRAYELLITEWLSYMKHLQRDYPYLFSLAVRTNPFDPSASVEFG